eukprot:GEMP01095130.1.p1 GENE.GEMP01095130.1~~GEMP01095130.1.p1  ORF type:complete len:209 (+),score=28.34 GEMP01095130.1:66-692(+)
MMQEDHHVSDSDGENESPSGSNDNGSHSGARELSRAWSFAELPDWRDCDYAHFCEDEDIEETMNNYVASFSAEAVHRRTRDRSRSRSRHDAIFSGATAIAEELRRLTPATSHTVLGVAKAAVKNIFPGSRTNVDRLQTLVAPIAKAVTEVYLTEAAFIARGEIPSSQYIAFFPPSQLAKARAKATNNAPPAVKPAQPKRNARAKPKGA